MLCGNLKKSLSHLLLICNAERWDSGDPMFTAPFIHVTSPKKWVNKSFKEQHTATVWAEKARAAEDDEEYPDQGVEHKTHKSFTYKWTQHQSLSTCWLFPNTSPDHIFKKISLFFWFLSTLKKSCVVFASLTCTGNRHQEHKQHNHTCPHYIHDSLITVFLCVWTGLSLSLVHSWLFFFVFFSGCLVLSPPPLTLIWSEEVAELSTCQWTESLPVWTSEHRAQPSTPTVSLSDWLWSVQLLPKSCHRLQARGLNVPSFLYS